MHSNHNSTECQWYNDNLGNHRTHLSKIAYTLQQSPNGTAYVSQGCSAECDSDGAKPLDNSKSSGER